MHIPIPAILLPHTATLPHPFLLAAHAVPARRRLAASANQKSLLFPKKFRIFAQKGAAWTLGLARSKEKVLFGRRQAAGCRMRSERAAAEFEIQKAHTTDSALHALHTPIRRPSVNVHVLLLDIGEKCVSNVAGCRLPRRGKVEGKTFRAWQMKWKHRASPNPQRSPQSKKKKKKEREGCRKQGSKSEKQHLMRKDIRKMQMCRKQTHAHCAPLCCALLFCSVLDAENRTKDEGLALDTPSCCRWRWPKVDGGGNGILGHVRRFRTPTSPGPLSMCVRVCGCAFACVLVHPVGPASPACLCVCTSAKVAKWRLEKSPSPLPLPPIAVVIRKSGKSNFGRSSSNSRSGQTKGGEWNFGASLFK